MLHVFSVSAVHFGWIPPLKYALFCSHMDTVQCVTVTMFYEVLSLLCNIKRNIMK